MRYPLKQWAAISFLSAILFLNSAITVHANGSADSTRISNVSKNIMNALNSAIPFANTFTEVASLTGVLNGDVEWGDYDNDNDLDLIVTGRASNPANLTLPVPVTKLYKNTAGSFAEDTFNSGNLVQLVDGSAAWGDYDNDGDIDLLLTGYLADDHAGSRTVVYQNTAGVLVELPNVSIPGAYRGSCDWVDWDNDGDLDIFVSGWTWIAENTVTAIAKFWTNTNGVFTLSPYAIAGVFDGDIVSSDVDGDLDYDFFVTGGVDQTAIWINNQDTFFSPTGSFDGLSNSAAVWGDFDGDGDQDLIHTGTKANNDTGVIRLYKNTSGTFTLVGAAGLIGHYESSISAGDYDNDGDLDILLTGFRVPISSENTTLFTNDGTGNFTQATSSGLTTPVRAGEAKWADYDNDGDLDLVLIGSNSAQNTWYTKIYRNDLNVANTKPTTPAGLTSVQTDSEIIFSWNAATDTQGGTVSYNLRIGTTSGGREIMSTASSPTGFHRTAEPGNVKSGLSWKIKNITGIKYYWSVQAIDNTGMAGNFAAEAEAVVQLAPVNFKAEPGHQKVVLSWTNPNTTGHFVIYREAAETATPTNVLAASVNGTTYTDATAVNGTTYYYYIKAEDASGNASAIKTANAKPDMFTDAMSLLELQYGSSTWGDYDGDGDYDLAHIGALLNSAPVPAVKFYNNANGNFTEVNGPAIVSGVLTYGSWNDYDNDNDLDLLVTGISEPQTYLLKNTGGAFSLVANTGLSVAQGLAHSWADFDNDGDADLGLPGTSNKFLFRNNRSDFSQVGELPGTYSIAWGDYNNDGDMDYALGSGIYDNRNGVFTKILDMNGGAGVVAWADIDNDKDLDLIASSVFSNDGSKSAVIYRNDGSAFTAVPQSVIESMTGAEIVPANIATGDYDNDGDTDLLIAGSRNVQPAVSGATIYINNGSGIFSKEERIALPDASFRTISWADYDGDGDLDIVMYGRPGTDAVVNKILRNNINGANDAPSVPSGLLAMASDSKITFSWNASSDTQGGPITYNLRVGTTPGGSEIMSAMANVTTGKLLTPSVGNVQLNRSWSLNGLGAGTYYWSVQAVDGAFAASAFASEKQFTLAAQTITFAELAPVKTDQVPFDLIASASSGLPVTFTSSNTLVATISGNKITIVAAGTTDIKASQGGNGTYAAAVPVTRTLTVNKSDQTITFPVVSAKTLGDAPFTLTATVSSSLTVQFSTTSDKITLNGTTATIVKAGSVTVTASQTGNANYSAALPVDRTFCINPAKPTITLTDANTENIILTSSATAGNQWYLNGAVIPSATSVTYKPAGPGIYKVQVSVEGCVSAFSNDQSLIVTGDIKSTGSFTSDVQLYPNPVKDRLLIDLPDRRTPTSTVYIMRMDGSAMEEVTTKEATLEVNVAHYSTGVYLVKVNHNGVVRYKKFLKQ